MPIATNDLSPQVKQKIDKVLIALSKPDFDYATQIAKQLSTLSSPLDLTAIRKQANLHPGGANAELVVIAIIAILIGLLLPAVQKVREAANSSQGSSGVVVKYNQAIALVKTLA